MILTHGVRANNWVDCLEVGSDIFGRTTGLVVELEPTLLGDLLEERLGEGPGQALEKLLVRLADAIVDFIT